ncbi:GatB/YqeY domain-containing protein [Enterococcus hirae]|nr:GatB/YqeY domain-containing protein [Enterococcus hirae]
MSLKDTLNADMKQAMKAKDKETLSVIRMLKAAVQNEEIKTGHPLTEEEELTLLAREMKQRKDSHKEFEAAGRSDLAEKAQEEIKVLSQYMPQPLSDAELEAIVQRAIQKTGAKSPKEFGKVMGVVMPQVKGKADGTQVQAFVKKLLNA